MKPTDEREPGRGAAFLLAVLMHILFFILLVFGISWQSRHPQVTAVDLWSDLPPPPQPVEPPKPAPEVKAPLPPQPEAKPEPKPEPKPEAKPEPVKPDILLKEKVEKEKAEKEKRKREELQRLAEVKRKVEAEQQRQTRDQMAKEEEERQTKQDREAALKTFQTEQAATQAAAQDRLVKDYIEKIRAQIRRNVMVPPDIQGNPQAVYKVVLLPGGYVLSAKLEKSSGVPAYDDSIERAINKAQPLPLPPDPALFPRFRELDLQFQPND